MLFSLKLRIDAATDSFLLEIEPGAVTAKSYPIAFLGEGRIVMLNASDDGLVTSLSIPGAGALLAEMAADVVIAQKAAAPAPAGKTKPKPPVDTLNCHGRRRC